MAVRGDRQKVNGKVILTLWVVASVCVFMWVLPGIGHQMLMRDDYYGMARTPYFDVNKADCEISDGTDVKGLFLGIYPYEAMIFRTCIWDEKTQTRSIKYVGIKASKPRNFLESLLYQSPQRYAESYKLVFAIQGR